MSEHFLTRAKAYVALVSVAATYLLSQYGPDTQFGHVLTIAVGLAGVFGTYQVGNQPAAQEGD